MNNKHSYQLNILMPIQVWTQMSVDSMFGCLTVFYDKCSSMIFLYVLLTVLHDDNQPEH